MQVETIGDAYMVVGGLPERNTIHADCVANQALDMMHYCKQVSRPDNEQPITVSWTNLSELLYSLFARSMAN